MTGQSMPRRAPDPALMAREPGVAPTEAGELPGTQCARCGAFGTHYLTCPGLRLPSGYRLGDAPGGVER